MHAHGAPEVESTALKSVLPGVPFAGFFAGGAMVCWPLAAAASRDFFLNVLGLKETSVK